MYLIFIRKQGKSLRLIEGDFGGQKNSHWFGCFGRADNWRISVIHVEHGGEYKRGEKTSIKPSSV